MARYTVTGPDGTRYEVNAPNGASQQEVLAYAQANQGQARMRQLEDALRKADAAGNGDDALALANEIRQMRAQSGQANVAGPWQKYSKAGGPWERYQQSPPAQSMTRVRRVQYPDGSVHRIEAPVEASENDVLAFAESQYRQPPRRMKLSQVSGQSRKPDFSDVRGEVRSTEGAGGELRRSAWASRAPLPPTLEETNAANRAYQNSPGAAIDRARYEADQLRLRQERFREMSLPLRFAVGAGSRVAAAGRGAGQLFARVADQVAPRHRTLSDLVAGTGSSRYQEALAQEQKARESDRFMDGDVAAGVGKFAGDVGLVAVPGGGVAGLSGKTALLANAALGAGYAGLQPVVHGESRAENALYGGAFSVAGHGLGSTVGYVGRRAANAIPEDVRRLAQRADQLGIPLHAAQVSQSLPVKVAASAGKYLPFSGYAGAASRQQEAVNRAVSRTFGADAPKLTDDVMRNARKGLSQQFEEIYRRNVVPLTEQGARKLAAIEREASRRLTNAEAQVLRNQLDDILANAEDGVLSGPKYQAVRTSLKKAEGTDKLGLSVRELRQALDDIAAQAVGPSDAGLLKTLRSQWANFRTVEAALKQLSGAGGDIRLASLWALIRKGSTREMRELARLGQTVLKDPIADSGTAQRTLMYNLLMGGTSLANPAMIPLVAKAAIGGATVGRAANSNTLARMLTRESRGLPTSKLAELMKKESPSVAPAAGAEHNRRR